MGRYWHCRGSSAGRRATCGRGACAVCGLARERGEMSHPHLDGGANAGLANNATSGNTGHFGAPADDTIEELGRDNDEFIATVATVGVVGLGVIAFEAALLPGLVLGVA